MDLEDPANTAALLRLNAVVGVTGFFDDAGALESVGIQCALCHSTVDDSLVPGVGRRRDGWANRDLDVGRLISLAPDLSFFEGLLGVDRSAVVGVLETKGQSMMGTDQDDIILVPIGAARSRVLGSPTLAAQRSVSTIWVKVAEGFDTTVVQEQVRALLRQRHRHRLQTGADDDFSLRNLAELMAAQEASSRVLAMLLAAVASVSLVVGGIGIMNIMLVSVTERTREIGIRLAIGALEREVLLQFLVEAVVLASLGGFMGIALATGASIGLAKAMSVPYVFNPGINLLSFLFAVVIGVAFGYFPARRAAQLDPIEALRHE